MQQVASIELPRGQPTIEHADDSMDALDLNEEDGNPFDDSASPQVSVLPLPYSPQPSVPPLPYSPGPSVPPLLYSPQPSDLPLPRSPRPSVLPLPCSPRSSSFPSRLLDPQDAVDAVSKMTSVSEHLPTTNDVGASQSLEPGRLVSATAIQTALRTIFPYDDGPLRIIDPGYVDIMNLKSIEQKPPLRLAATHRYMIIPVHTEYHWSLIAIDIVDQTFLHFDSLPSVGLQDLAKKAMPVIVKYLVRGPDQSSLDESRWTFKPMPSASQGNTYDCGVFVMINALRYLRSDVKPPSMAIDADLWRLVFQSLIGGEAFISSASGEGQVQATTTPSITDSMPAKSFSQVVEAERQQREAGTTTLQNLLTEKQQALAAAKIAVQQARSIITVLEAELDSVQTSQSKAIEQIAEIEDQLDASERFISEYSNLTIARKSTLDSMRVDNDQARQESTRLKRKSESCRRGIGGIQAALKTASAAHESRECRYWQLGQEVKGMLEKQREFWKLQQAAAREQEKMCVDGLAGLSEQMLSRTGSENS